MNTFAQHTLHILITACATMAFGAASAAAAEDAYPSRQVRLIVPYAAGGTSDLLTRYIAQQLSDAWSQPVIVENRPGAGTVIGSGAVAKANPDGYTLLMTNNTHVINPQLMATVPYDPLNDFTPIARLASSPYLLLLKPSLPAGNLQEYIALAKSKPGQLNFGTGGPGGLTHLGGELFNAMAGVDIAMIHYKGAAPLTAAALGGEIDAYLDVPATTRELVESGKLRAAGTTGPQRIASMPDVPTISEAGVPGFDVTISYVILGPAGLPANIQNKIDEDINRILAKPDVQERLRSLELTPFPAHSAEVATWLKAEQEKYGEVIKTAGIKAE